MVVPAMMGTLCSLIWICLYSVVVRVIVFTLYLFFRLTFVGWVSNHPTVYVMGDNVNVMLCIACGYNFNAYFSLANYS
jgi:hypothetical protein